jgi:transcriptional regulator with XRE-family HTH domain
MEIRIHGKEQLGAALRRFRKAGKKTQMSLSRDSRLEQGMISKIETGERLPEVGTLLHLCSVLGIELVLRERNVK